MPEFIVFSGDISHQLRVGALLNNGALMEHGNFIAELTGGQPVGDIDCGLISGNLIELTVNFRLRNRIKRGGRLIQNDERRILVERTGNGDLLCFTATFSPSFSPNSRKS